MGIDFRGVSFPDDCEYGNIADSNTITMAVWAKHTSSTANDGYCGSWASGSLQHILYQRTTTQQTGLVRQSTTNKLADSTTNYNDDKWNLLAGGGDASNARFYANAGDNDITGDAYTTINTGSGNFVTGSYGPVGPNKVVEEQWCAVWSVWLENKFLDALFHGVPPFVIRNDALIFYAPQYDNADTQPEWTGGTVGTLTTSPPLTTTNPPIQQIQMYMP